MAVLNFAALQNLFLDELQANVATDAPFTAAEIARFLNDAYADVWEASGGAIKNVASATAWTSAHTATGVVTGILTDIREITRIWASTTSASVGVSSGDNELDRAELSMIQWLRKSALTGAYDRPKCYAATRLATVTPSSVGIHRLDYWPSVIGYYLPTEYIPQLTEIDSVTVTTPDVNDIESRDIGLLAAARGAPLIGRAELVPSIMARVTSKAGLAIIRKRAAMLSGDQDREEATIQ